MPFKSMRDSIKPNSFILESFYQQKQRMISDNTVVVEGSLSTAKGPKSLYYISLLKWVLVISQWHGLSHTQEQV